MNHPASIRVNAASLLKHRECRISVDFGLCADGDHMEYGLWCHTHHEQVQEGKNCVVPNKVN